MLSRLKRLDLSALPDGVAIRATMTRMWTASYRADLGYRGWLYRLSRGQSCSASDSGRSDGDEASQAAMREKRAFVELWSAVASQLGVKAYSDSSL